MKLVNISDDYIKYLQQFSPNVKYNRNRRRPYVGIILTVEKHTYFAPLGSPKEKHKHMKESLDFVKIKNGEMGVINLNNMIPVISECILEIKRECYDDEYKKLLLEQERWVIRNRDIVYKKASKLYTLITTKKDTRFHLRSSDFKLLEEKSLMWKK